MVSKCKPAPVGSPLLERIMISWTEGCDAGVGTELRGRSNEQESSLNEGEQGSHSGPAINCPHNLGPNNVTSQSNSLCI